MSSIHATPRIGILHVDDLSDFALHVQGGYPDLYAHLFRHQDVELVEFRTHEGETPASLDDCDAWVMGGAKVSTYDDHSWIVTAEELIVDIVAQERPFLGVCFGHQLLAQALGGQVLAAEVGWGVGAHTYRTNAALPWLPEAAGQSTLLTSHQDQVVSVPTDAKVWSSSSFCPVAGLLVGERAWSVQGHPEFTAPVAEALYNGRRDMIGQATVDAAITTLDRPLSNDAIAAAVVRQARNKI